MNSTNNNCVIGKISQHKMGMYNIKELPVDKAAGVPAALSVIKEVIVQDDNDDEGEHSLTPATTPFTSRTVTPIASEESSDG